MKRCATAMAAALVIVLAVPSATAHERFVGDADDSDAAIDIARVRHGHYFAQVLVRITAHDRWEPEDLGRGRIVVSFDTDRDAAVERRGVVEYVEGSETRLRSRVLNAHGRKVGRATQRRPSARSLELWFGRGTLGDPNRYSAFVTVRIDGQADRAPDAGVFDHRLRALCFRNEATITGTNEADRLRGTPRDDVIYARGGDDVITNVHNGDTVCAGGGADVIEAGAGWMFLRGGAGADRIRVAGPDPEPCDDTGGEQARMSCVYPEALALGSRGGDVLIGGRRHEYLSGGRGNDVLRGRGWSDRLHGGPGKDRLRGGRGDDSCRAGEDLRSCEE